MATGASAAVPPVPGLKDTPHLTNSNFWNLEELPPRMGVIGAGPIGLEMSQAMQRFGCKVNKEKSSVKGIGTSSIYVLHGMRAG